MRVTSEMNTQLAVPFSSDEVFSTLSQMGSLKYWHLVGSNITSFVLDFLNLHRMTATLNFTFIVLIPKTSRPKHITEFRPISLCNAV